MANNIAAVLSESYDDVLSAVQETQRGRWFLDEFTKRSKQQDTQSILTAIARLEKFVSTSSVTGTGVEDGLIAEARKAIAAAKAQIKTENKTLSSGLSEEAKLFAKLAEQARSSITNDLSVAKSVDIAMNLIDDLDHKLGGSTVVQTPESQAVYFRRDEDLFVRSEPKAELKAVPSAVERRAEPPASLAPAPVAVEATPVAKPEPIKVAKPAESKVELDSVPRGAKLTINRVAAKLVDAQPAQQSAPVEVPTAQPAKAEILETPADVSEPMPVKIVQAEAKPRIVITRRKSEDMIEVPLVDQAASQSAA